MKIIKSFFLLVFILPITSIGQTKASITIQNNLTVDQTETVVSVKWQDILSSYPQIDTANFIIINPSTKKQIPFQLEYKGSAAVQNLLLQVNVKAKSTLNLSIQKGKPEIFAAKTYFFQTKQSTKLFCKSIRPSENEADLPQAFRRPAFISHHFNMQPPQPKNNL